MCCEYSIKDQDILHQGWDLACVKMSGASNTVRRARHVTSRISWQSEEREI